MTKDIRAKHETGQLVIHTASGNHGFIRAIDSVGRYIVEFSGPVTNSGYEREEIEPVRSSWHESSNH